MTTFLIFYVCFYIITLIVVSIADAIFEFSDYGEKLIARLIYSVVTCIVILMGVYQFHKEDTLLKVEDHGVTWIKDDYGIKNYSLGSDLVLFMTEDRQLHIKTKSEYQNIRFDSNSANRIVGSNNCVKLF
jgi:hypothetical protein